MIKAKAVLTAWDKTLEMRDFSHLAVFCLLTFNLKIQQEKLETWQTLKAGVSRANSVSLISKQYAKMTAIS